MHLTRAISLTLPIAWAVTGAGAQDLMDPDGQYIVPSMLLEDLDLSLEESFPALEPISQRQLMELRSAGIDPSWISDRFDIPSFDATLRRVTQGDDPAMIESWATHYTDHRGVDLGDTLSFSVGRTTELRDGNISGNAGSLPGGSGDDHIPSFAQSEGEYDIYDLSLEWKAMSAGPVTLSVLSGLKAIEANIGKRVLKGGDTTIESEHRVTAMPMIGSGVRWKVNDMLSFSGAAMTHPIERGDALIDFNASTDLRISSNVGFSAGYRIIRSSFDVGSVSTELEQQGLFARLEISF